MTDGTRLARRLRHSLMLAMLALLTSLAPELALAADKHAAFAIDANTGAVLHSEQADEPRFPASLTKMMTLYLAFEAIERGRISYATRIKVSQEAASQPPTKLDLDPGETIALIDAAKSLITKSANDMAVAIAEHLAGSESNFARLMTEKARLMGMSQTTFRNASGLPDPGQVSTARDMVTLALRLHDDFPVHYKLFAMRSFTYGNASFRNHNNLLFNFQGTEGIKTGYTRASGFNLVASVRRGPRHVIGAVFGGSSSSRRDDAMRLILSRALFKASPVFSRKPAPMLVAAAKPAPRPAPAQASAQLPAQLPAARPSPPPPTAPVAMAVPAPKPAQRPRPVAAASEPQPEPAPATLQPVTQTEPQPSPFKIDVARVKPVMVPLRSRPTEIASLAPAEPAAPAPAPAPAQPVLQAPLPPPQPAAPPSAPPGAQPMRGAPPGTLGQQAARIIPPASPSTPAQTQTQLASTGRATDPASTRSSLRGPPPANEPTRSAAGGFEVQIGAYASAAEAEKALAAVRATTGDLLQARTARASLVQKDNRQLYRARFSGFDSVSAASACLELRRRQVDCFVMKAE